MLKNPLANARDAGPIPGLGRSPEEGNGSPLQWENSMNRGAWWVTVLGSQRAGHDGVTNIVSDDAKYYHGFRVVRLCVCIYIYIYVYIYIHFWGRIMGYKPLGDLFGNIN